MYRIVHRLTEAESPLAGNWSQRFGVKEATVACQVRAPKEGGKVQIELFADDVANWSFQSDVIFGPEWKTVTVTLRYDWNDEEAAAAGWLRAANGFSWMDTIQHIGKVVIVPVAAETQDRFDLDELLVTGEQLLRSILRTFVTRTSSSNVIAELHLTRKTWQFDSSERVFLHHSSIITQ